VSDVAPPLIFDWSGDAMVPRLPKIADRYFVVGESYRLVQHEERSQSSHRFYFASINEAWKNLPEDLAEQFATADHLRKYALIRCGYRDERSIVAASKAEAQRVAAFIKPMDEFAVVTVSESVVTVYTAKSQSTRAMGKKDFAESKNKVLDYVASLIKVSREELEKNAGEAA
jgi:hypothetical protein